jgi:spoIIIJ-associated protein
MNQSEIKKAKEIVENFLDTLGVNAKVKVFAVEEYLKIEIEGKDSSLLIGYHGDNLRALRHIISIILRNKLSDDVVVMIDVAGYLAGKEERIRGIAKKAIEKLEKTGKPQELPQMDAYERRLAHSFLSDEGYNSDSVGEGRNRHIEVKK